jgi:MFS transporter, SP family, general alpha glucoside:H+ symporter
MGIGPWWLVRKGRTEEAERVVTRIARPGFYDDNEAAGFVAFIKHTDALQRVEANAGSWKELFMGVNRRRTEIVSFRPNLIDQILMVEELQMLGVWLVQLWNGNIITGLTVEL